MQKSKAIKAAWKMPQPKRQLVLDALRGPLALDDIPAATKTTERQVVGVYLLNAIDFERAVLRRVSL